MVGHHSIDINDKAHRQLLEPNHEIVEKIVHFGAEGQDIRKDVNLGPVEHLRNISAGKTFDVGIDLR